MTDNITFITAYFAPAWSYGGPPRVLYTLAKELSKRGKKVKVITTDTQGKRRNRKEKELIEGIKVHRLRTVSNYLSYKNKLFLVPSLLTKTKNILGESDVVLFSEVRSLINWQVYRFLVEEKIPYGLFAFGQIPRGAGLKAVVKKIFDYLWVKEFVEEASFRFAQTSHEQEMFTRFFNIPSNETSLLPLPVETDRLKNRRKLINQFRKKWNIKKQDQVLLFVGRLHFLKGVDILITALEPLFKENSRLKLLIVGRDDGEKGKLAKMASSRLGKQIIFTGPLYGDDVWVAYSQATCFVFTPRFYEETSLASLEALSFGTPVVVTRQATIPYLEDYQAGFIVDNNPSSICSAVIKLLDRLDRKKQVVQNNSQKLIQDKFSPREVTDKLLEILLHRKG